MTIERRLVPAEGTFHDGPISRYEATYTDIVTHVELGAFFDRFWAYGPNREAGSSN